MPFYITEQGAKHLKEYRYSGSDQSYVYRFILTPMNEFLINFFPMWLAPNCITLIGLFFCLTAHLTCFIFNPTFDQAMPAWAYVLCAFCLFAYQTLDNLDGKQARRTQSSSPLGLLFDHGIDALNVTLSSITVGSCLTVGTSLRLFVLWSCAFIPFVFATWEEYYTAHLHLGVLNGPTDGVLICIMGILLNFFIQPGFWAQPISAAAPSFLLPYIPDQFESWPANTFICLLGLIGVIPTVTHNIFYVYSHLLSNKETSHGRVSLFDPWYRIVPFVVCYACAVTWYMYSPSQIFFQYPRLFLWAHGFLFCNMVCKLMLAHLTKEEYRPLRLVLLPIVLSVINACALPQPIVPEHITLFFCALSSFGVWLHFVTFTIREVSAALDIYVLSIKHVKAKST